MSCIQVPSSGQGDDDDYPDGSDDETGYGAPQGRLRGTLSPGPVTPAVFVVGSHCEDDSDDPDWPATAKTDEDGETQVGGTRVVIGVTSGMVDDDDI